MDQKVFILIGRSGSGKGTQGELIQKYLKDIDPARDTLYVTTGAEFREFIKGDSITQKISNELYITDKLQPEFLSVYMWINALIKNYKGNQHIIFDGTPRRRHEAGVLDSIFEFYNLKDIYVLNIDISEELATQRLMDRHRMDDKPEDIKKRLAWYETDVVPAIEYYKDNKKYNFLHIDGNGPVENVHTEIISRLNFK